MQVFKSYFKVQKKYLGFMFMYIGIMTGVLSAVTANASRNSGETYRTATVKFAVFDRDKSAASSALADYLAETHAQKEIAGDDKKTIQDELYARNVENVLLIPEGFGEALANGSFSSSKDAADNPAALEIITIPGTQAARYFETAIDNYLGIIHMYLSAGYTVEEANSRTAEVLKQEVDVSLPDGGSQAAHSNLYTFFNYLGWVMVALLISVIGPVLQVYNKKELRDRISCSSYKFMNMNSELFFGVIVTGLGITLILVLLSVVMLQGAVFSEKGLYLCLNAVCYLFVALSLAFLAGKLTNRQEHLSMMANVISLGMAFLCGIFVPAEYLGDGVVKASHLLPAYWFNQANMNIDFHLSTEKLFIFICMGVQLLFAALFVILGLLAARRQTVAH